ncbi:hypothetical protein FIBSPDRAFT_949723 [Athelia psychrophila]|uniref:Uncharacterized protein n=1 Tax=Athelia psychrophila TaxID=1759441 RepID=A0A166PB82_9AGAM|nr:hypothetical protein FIBSPDRAFT_949723 [Fibularhizoctonia sp. CBS 109695]
MNSTDISRSTTPENDASRKIRRNNDGSKKNLGAQARNAKGTPAQEDANTGEKHARERAGTTSSMTSNGVPRDGVDNQNDITDPSFQTDPPPPGNENAAARDEPPANSGILGRIKKYKVTLTDTELLDRVQEGNTQNSKDLDDPFSPDSLVPTPLGGWPAVHTRVPTIVLDNVKKTQSRIYLDEPSQVAVALPMYYNSWDGDESGKVADKIINAIQGYFKVATVTVAPANEQLPTKGPNDPPYTYFISDIPNHVYDALIAQECVASNKIQFIVRPLRYQGPCAFMGSVMGLVNIQNMSTKREGQLLDDFRELLYSTPNTYTALLDIALDFYNRDASPTPSNCDNADVEMNPEDDMDYFVHDLLGDLRISILLSSEKTGIPKPAVNMYLEIPGNNDQTREAVKQAFANVAYDTSRFGKGFYQAGWRCRMCRAIDHPTGLCPFTNVPGWTDIVPERPSDKTAQAATSNTPQRGSMRGRGHGQQRGGPQRGRRGETQPRGRARGRGF